MKLIRRDSYLNKLKSVQGTPDIKVITGVRRSGKSKLMEAFIDYLYAQEDGQNIIHINFNLTRFESLAEYHALHDHIEGLYAPDKKNFVFIDEVQMCEGFEKAINSLHASGRYDIYVTGSNAFLLSSDLATLFTGRTFEIEVFPFSFAEYCAYFGNLDIREAFEGYTRDGGMAGSYLYREPADRYRYIANEFDTVIIRDIRQKYNVRSADLLERLSDFLMDNIGNVATSRAIADTFTSARNAANHKTVSSYISYLCNAFVFYQVRRYDVRGKRYLSSGNKLYLCDHSFKYAKLGTRNLDYGRTYENMVAIELMRRGYEIYAGMLYKKEIDFVAIKRNEKLYIQVCDDISKLETLERECDSLLKIKDAYPKIILANTRHDEYTYEGIRIIDLASWLLGNAAAAGECTVENWRNFVGKPDSGWRECREEEFKILVARLSRLADKYHFSIWVAGTDKPFSLSLSTDGFERSASPGGATDHGMAFGIRMNPKERYGYYYAADASAIPKHTALSAYNELVGYQVEDVVEFAEGRLRDYVAEFGIPTTQPYKHTMRLDKIGEANRYELIQEMLRMIDWDQGSARKRH